MTDETLSRAIAECVYPGRDWSNHHRDMINNPAMTLLLLGKLLVSGSKFENLGQPSDCKYVALFG